MLWKRQQELLQEMSADLSELLSGKGREYASDADALANFKGGAEIGISPEQKLWVFLDKHLCSIKSYIRNGKVLSNEPIEGRVHDAIGYLFLLLCLIDEKKTETQSRGQDG